MAEALETILAAAPPSVEGMPIATAIQQLDVILVQWKAARDGTADHSPAVQAYERCVVMATSIREILEQLTRIMTEAKSNEALVEMPYTTLETRVRGTAQSLIVAFTAEQTRLQLMASGLQLIDLPSYESAATAFYSEFVSYTDAYHVATVDVVAHLQSRVSLLLRGCTILSADHANGMVEFHRASVEQPEGEWPPSSPSNANQWLTQWRHACSYTYDGLVLLAPSRGVGQKKVDAARALQDIASDVQDHIEKLITSATAFAYDSLNWSRYTRLYRSPYDTTGVTTLVTLHSEIVHARDAARLSVLPSIAVQETNESLHNIVQQAVNWADGLRERAIDEGTYLVTVLDQAIARRNAVPEENPLWDELPDERTTERDAFRAAVEAAIPATGIDTWFAQYEATAKDAAARVPAAQQTPEYTVLQDTFEARLAWLRKLVPRMQDWDTRLSEMQTARAAIELDETDITALTAEETRAALENYAAYRQRISDFGTVLKEPIPVSPSIVDVPWYDTALAALSKALEEHMLDTDTQTTAQSLRQHLHQLEGRDALQAAVAALTAVDPDAELAAVRAAFVRKSVFTRAELTKQIDDVTGVLMRGRMAAANLERVITEWSDIESAAAHGLLTRREAALTGWDEVGRLLDKALHIDAYGANMPSWETLLRTDVALFPKPPTLAGRKKTEPKPKSQPANPEALTGRYQERMRQIAEFRRFYADLLEFQEKCTHVELISNRPFGTLDTGKVEAQASKVDDYMQAMQPRFALVPGAGIEGLRLLIAQYRNLLADPPVTLSAPLPTDELGIVNDTAQKFRDAESVFDSMFAALDGSDEHAAVRREWEDARSRREHVVGVVRALLQRFLAFQKHVSALIKANLARAKSALTQVGAAYTVAAIDGLNLSQWHAVSSDLAAAERAYTALIGDKLSASTVAKRVQATAQVTYASLVDLRKALNALDKAATQLAEDRATLQQIEAVLSVTPPMPWENKLTATVKSLRSRPWTTPDIVQGCTELAQQLLQHALDIRTYKATLVTLAASAAGLKRPTLQTHWTEAIDTAQNHIGTPSRTVAQWIIAQTTAYIAMHNQLPPTVYDWEATKKSDEPHMKDSSWVATHYPERRVAVAAYTAFYIAWDVFVKTWPTSAPPSIPVKLVTFLQTQRTAGMRTAEDQKSAFEKYVKDVWPTLETTATAAEVARLKAQQRVLAAIERDRQARVAAAEKQRRDELAAQQAARDAAAALLVRPYYLVAADATDQPLVDAVLKAHETLNAMPLPVASRLREQWANLEARRLRQSSVAGRPPLAIPEHTIFVEREVPVGTTAPPAVTPRTDVWHVLGTQDVAWIVLGVEGAEAARQWVRDVRDAETHISATQSATELRVTAMLKKLAGAAPPTLPRIYLGQLEASDFRPDMPRRSGVTVLTRAHMITAAADLVDGALKTPWRYLRVEGLSVYAYLS